MKYANSLKYINGFEKATSRAAISQKRVMGLCASLGRVNVGAKHIVLPEGAAGHATAVMLESVIKNAGYRVGRITSDSDFDARSAVFLGGEMADIEDFNKCVAELKSAVMANTDEQYLKEEIVMALSLLLCKLYGCEFIILEGLSNGECSLDAVCAPYDLVILPTVYSGEADSGVISMCEAIKRGVREVVIGNQKSGVYSPVSDACMTAGARLNVTAKPTMTVNEMTARRVEFSYSDREGFVLKSPSYILRDCAMAVIESALALRRDGIKMPWSSIAAGLESASNTCCFDILSVSPAIIVDSASTACEIASVVETFEGTVERADSIVVCIMSQSAKMLKDQLLAFGDRKIKCLIVYGLTDGDVIGMSNASVCDKVSGAAKQVYTAYKNKDTVFCLGSVAFAREIKNEFIKLMGL